jgi:hypothetical protein
MLDVGDPLAFNAVMRDFELLEVPAVVVRTA